MTIKFHKEGFAEIIGTRQEVLRIINNGGAVIVEDWHTCGNASNVTVCTEEIHHNGGWVGWVIGCTIIGEPDTIAVITR